MKKLLFILATLLYTIQIVQAQNPTKDAVLGEWLSESKDGKVLIFKQGDKYFGKLSWIKDAAKKDVNNPDASLRSQPLLGLVILKNFEFTGKAWEEGSIYDPKNGKSYSCNMKLKKADELEIRGFVGVSLLGRTTVWTKVK
ncbi:DUF2147 domain-containing protein [Flectobacillus longus]|jgi:uncharacterized protein (DUF2147 family)|uniref:DUF2147 domain-containing protein n=1 Tax=Flectobacillus longus TaxID=2984207 RepID=UPI0024B72223|nr:DUF2147 domain-containing protein [Flectobacillus longus]MDI9881463.1 DUF2147 domain-containing protein [Flectobacillus longus]